MLGSRYLTQTKIQGYYPGVVGKITELHAVYYHDNWGFNVTFETQVGRELSEFMGRFDEKRDGLWVATQDDVFAGSIAIDGVNSARDGARLRWFIVDPRFWGCGIGRKLIAGSIEFCRQTGFPSVFLWTFRGLENARRLYESVGFRLCEESRVEQWGQTIMEQKYEFQIAYNKP
jgi:GNAT superfamily N-acetyltransferase